jgi:hypothetical protein
MTKYCKGCGCYVEDTVKHSLFHEQLDDLVTAVNELKDLTATGFSQMAEFMGAVIQGGKETHHP